MNNHIEEHKIELMLLDHPEISIEEREEISIHFETCRLCKENYLKLKNFYEEIESENELELSSEGSFGKEDSDFAQKLLRKKRYFATKLLQEPKKAVKVYDSWVEITEPYVRTKIQKFVRFVRQHPKGFTGSLAFASLFFILLFYTSVIKTKNDNPSYAWVEKEVLYVQNTDGQILWKMNAPGIRQTNSNETADLNQGKIILIDDIDGDYKKEVLIAGDWMIDSGIPSDSLFCYNYSGKLLWKSGGWEFPQLTARKWIHTIWYIRDFIVIRDSKRNESRLFVLANDNLFSPAIFLELDVKTGKVRQRFYNVGGTALISNFDFDGDGQAEVLLGGINDPYKRAYLAVFDINNISGYSPSTKEYLPKDIAFGSFKYYIIFPFTKLGQILGQSNQNSINYMKSTKKEIIAATAEVLAGKKEGEESSVLYHFDRTMKVKSVHTGDDFNKNHQRLTEEGKLNEELSEAFYENLKNSVRYWDGEKFVDTVSVNKYYNFGFGDSNSSMRYK